MKSVVAAAACFAALAIPALAAEPIPPQPTTSAVDSARCKWVWQTGGGIGVWTEECKLDTGQWKLKFAKDLPGFDLFVDDGNTGTVIQVFSKPAGADVSAILPELRRRGYIADDSECIFAPAGDEAGKAKGMQAFFQVVPTGQKKADFDATPADEVPDPPCGAYGVNPDGVSFFLADSAHPDKVIYLNLGQDGTLFDPATLTFFE